MSECGENGDFSVGGQLPAGITRVERRLMLQKRYVMIAKHHDLQISGGIYNETPPFCHGRELELPEGDANYAHLHTATRVKISGKLKFDRY